jgi:hypothetical protein
LRESAKHLVQRFVKYIFSNACQVGPSAKGWCSPRQHQGPNFAFFCFNLGFANKLERLKIYGIPALGSVQREQSHIVTPINKYSTLAHC